MHVPSSGCQIMSSDFIEGLLQPERINYVVAVFEQPLQIQPFLPLRASLGTSIFQEISIFPKKINEKIEIP
jgi:hypothetical protein